MRNDALKYSIVAIATAGLAAIGLPAATGATTLATNPHALAAPPPLGNTCLVGTWHDNGGWTSTQWNGSQVSLQAGGGDVDHIASTGLDTDSFAKAKPAVGTYRKHRLTQRVHGTNSLQLRATGHGKHAKLRYVEKGWTAASSIHFAYHGHHTTGYLSQEGVHSYHYTCTAKKLTIFGHKGNVLETETRTSRKP
jgi:hypothetical protein